MDRQVRPRAFRAAAFFQAGLLLAAAAAACAPSRPGPSSATAPSGSSTRADTDAAPGASDPATPPEAADGAKATASQDGSTQSPSRAATPSADPGAAAPALAPLPPPAGTKVLHVGDSFAGALGIPLGELLEQAGVRSILKHKDSSYLTTWAWEPELERELWHYNPDLVVVTLGANELGIADPEQRAKTVRKIVSTIGKRPCLWVAIPLWSERHNGLLEVIEESSAPCIFYDTNAELDTLKMERIHDGIHPTNAARRDWAQAVFEYMLAHRQPREGAPWWLVADPAAAP